MINIYNILFISFFFSSNLIVKNLTIFDSIIKASSFSNTKLEELINRRDTVGTHDSLVKLGNLNHQDYHAKKSINEKITIFSKAKVPHYLQ